MLELSFRKRLAAFTLEVDLRAGNEAVALLGASGSGKSMTLKCIAGVEKPDSGRIVLDGRVLFDAAHGIDLPPQARRVGLLFQSYALFPTMNVQQNILCGMRHLPKPERRARCEALIRRFHLEGLEKRMPALLSGGQQQRVALARMLAGQPALLLLDEPFSALDSFLRWELEQTVAEVVGAHGGTTLFVSHNRDEAYRLCGRVAVMDRGRIEVYKPKNELFSRPETSAAARLIGCENIALANCAEGMAQIPAWGMQLRVSQHAPFSPRAVGIPAAALRLGEGENAFAARVERVIECPAGALVVVRPEGAAESLRCLTGKAIAMRLGVGARVTLSVRADAVWPLR